MLSARWREMDAHIAADYPPPKMNRNCDSKMLSHHHIVHLSKKRKHLVEATEKSDSPALKHACCATSDITVHSRKEISPDGNPADMRVEYTQNGNSSDDSRFQGTVLNFNSDDQKPQSHYDYLSTSRSQSGTFAPASSSSSSLNSGTTYDGNVIIIPSTGRPDQNHELCHSELHEDPSTDQLGEYVNSIAFALGKEKTDDEQLQEFLYSITMENELILDSARVSIETQQLAAPKPTIDKEFEEYFASLML